MSQLAQPEIEAIVRMVIDRLRDSGTPVGLTQSQTAGPAVGLASQTASTVTLSPAQTLSLTIPLVTLDDIHGKLSGIHTLYVSRRSLLTPAVKDELRKFNIKIVRGDSSSGSLSTTQSAMESTAYNVVASSEKLVVIKSLVKQATVTTLSTGLEMLDIVKQLAGLDLKQRSIWCASRPYATMMACSQSASLRAALIHQPADLQQAVLEMQPSLLVLDDSRWSGYQVGRLIAAWSRLGERQ